MSKISKVLIYKCPTCQNESLVIRKNAEIPLCSECWIKDKVKIRTFFLKEIYIKFPKLIIKLNN